MADLSIRIRGTSQWVVDMLDKIVAEEGYESRNQLINHILEAYATSRSDFFVSALPDITRELCRTAIDELAETVRTHNKNIEITYKHIARIADELRAVISSEDSSDSSAR